MSFGTYWGTNALDPVSYQKVLPKYLPDNAPATSVIRITDANPVTVPAPTVQNEALTVIDVAGELETFSINQIATPPADLTVLGVIPYTTPAGDFQYIVWGYEPDGVGQQRGCLYIYNPNDAVPANGIWTKRFITDTGVPQRIIAVCRYNYATTDSEGAVPAGAEYAIFGDFGQLSDADGANVVVALQLAAWDTAADTAAALPIAAGVGFFDPPPTGMFAIPTALSAVAKLGFISPFPIVDSVRTYQNICLYLTSGGGQFGNIGSNNNDGTFPTAAPAAIFTANMDYDNRLWLGGNFPQFQLGGVVPAGFSTEGMVCLTFSAVQPYFDTIINTGIVYPSFTSVLSIRNAYAGAFGGDNRLVVCGVFKVNIVGGGTATDIYQIATTYPVIAYTANPLIQANQVAYEPYASLMIDTSSYIAGNDLALNNNFTFGIDNNFVAGWDAVGGTYQTMFFNWYGKGINAVPPRPLSFIVIQKTVGAGNVYYSGSYQAAQQTTITFGGGATARYIKASGAVGNATQAIIAQQYASFSLVGDLANNIWDVIGTYGTIVFSP